MPTTPLNRAVEALIVNGHGTAFGATLAYIHLTLGRGAGGLHESGAIARLRGRISVLNLFIVAVKSWEGANNAKSDNHGRNYSVYSRANLMSLVRKHCFGLLDEPLASELRGLLAGLAEEIPPTSKSSRDFSALDLDDFAEPLMAESGEAILIEQAWKALASDGNIASDIFLRAMEACLGTMQSVYARAIEIGGHDAIARNLDLCSQTMPVDPAQMHAAHELLSFVNAAETMGMNTWRFGYDLSQCDIGGWEELFSEWEQQARLQPGSMAAVLAPGGWLERMGVVSQRLDVESWLSSERGPITTEDARVFVEEHADARALMLKMLHGAYESIEATGLGLDAFSHLGVDQANARSFAQSATPLRMLLVGETGSGKTALARACAKAAGKQAFGVACTGGADTLVRNLDILQNQANMLGNPLFIIDPLDAHASQENRGAALQHLLSPHARGRMKASEVWTLQSLKDIPTSLLSGFDLIIHLRAMPLAQREKLAARYFPEAIAKRVAQMSSNAGDVLAAAEWARISNSMDWSEISARMHGIQQAHMRVREQNDELPLQSYNTEGRREGFECVAGQEEAVARARKLIGCLRDPDRFKALNAASPKGVLLTGGPGMGKTYLARAMAVEAGVPFLTADCAAMARNANTIAAVFAEARKLAPCILFLDELDAIGTTAQGAFGASPDPERQGILNRLLMELDGVESLDGVLVIGATHRASLLDNALVRSGRLGWQIPLRAPDTQNRKKIWLHYAARSQCADTIDWDRVARISSGMTPADIAQAFNTAAMEAVEEDADRIGMKHLVVAVDETLWKSAASEVYLLEDEIWRTCVHEAGHALMAWHSGTEIERVSVRPRSAALGYVRMLSQDGKVSQTRDDMMAKIATSFGGLCAEEVVLGSASSGAESDLDSIRSTIAHCVRNEGMHSRFPAGLGDNASAHLIHQAERIEGQILSSMRNSTRDWLDAHRDALERFAQLLMQQREMEGPQIETVLSELLPEARGKRLAIEAVAAHQWGAKS